MEDRSGKARLRLSALLLVIAPLMWSTASVLPVHAQAPNMLYGANISTALGARKTAEMGLGWVRLYYPEQVSEAEHYGLKVLLLLGWESALTDLESWGNYVYEIVSRYRGRIAAYQICNEPNLAEMWHKPQHADPTEYVAFLREAYRRAKQADPNCLIVSAGMATNGGYGTLAMDDVEFIRGMYAAGAKPYFDVLGSHPYGFAYAPEDALSNPVHCFRRVEQQRAIMVQYGDAAKPIWATEFGWIIDPGEGCHYYGDWPSRWWQRVSPQTQADYLVRACRYARTNWPWMGLMFVWNMDYSTVSWNDYCAQTSWFAILNYDGTPRPAYLALAQMVQGPATPTATGTPSWSTPTPTASATPGSGSGIVAGRVLLQGRSNHWGTLVSVGGHSAVTGEDGSFRIEGVPAGMHELDAQMPGYLRYRYLALVVHRDERVILPDVLLRAGDINGDDVVNLFDLVAVAIRYGAQVPGGTPEDVNGDREVNLFDLVLVSTNYGATRSGM